jgi:hypothetical protein
MPMPQELEGQQGRQHRRNARERQQKRLRQKLPLRSPLLWKPLPRSHPRQKNAC